MHLRINNSNACGQLRVCINIVRPWGSQIQPRVSLIHIYKLYPIYNFYVKLFEIVRIIRVGKMFTFDCTTFPKNLLSSRWKLWYLCHFCPRKFSLTQFTVSWWEAENITVTGHKHIASCFMLQPGLKIHNKIQ